MCVGIILMDYPLIRNLICEQQTYIFFKQAYSFLWCVFVSNESKCVQEYFDRKNEFGHNYSLFLSIETTPIVFINYLKFVIVIFVTMDL